MNFFDQLRFLAYLRDHFGVSLDYERILQAHYARFLGPGDVVFDVGANEGMHTSRFAELVAPTGQVLAFEPIPHLAARLREQYQASGVVEVHNVALAHVEGRADFVFARGVPSESGLRQRRFNQPDRADPTRIEVDVRRADTFAAGLARLDFLKLDVEGGELDCLAGATDVLTRLRPVVSIEFGAAGYTAYGHARGDLWMLSERFGYRLFDILGNPIPDAGTWDAVCDRVYWDYFCVPAEKQEWFVSHIRPLWTAEP